jgi:hypothetical protein
LKGLDSNKRYRVRSEDGSVRQEVRSGAALMTEGLSIKLPGKFSSDLVFIEENL